MNDRSGSPALLDAADATHTSLWSNRNFQVLWSGSVFAFLGKEVSDLVYPLLILTLTGSPAWAGAFGGVQFLVSLLVGLPAGVLADAYDQRRLLIIMEAARAVASLSVLIAVLLDGITLAHLLAVSVVIGAVQPLGGSARMLLVRRVVPPQQLTAALTREEVRSHAVGLSGPGLGGVLYATAAVLPFVTTAVSFVVSLICALFVRLPQQNARAVTPADEDSMVTRVLAGLTLLWRVPILRHSTLFAAALNMVTAPLILVVMVLLSSTGASPTMVGLTSSGLAVGGLAGTLLVGPLHRALSPGALMLCLGGTAVGMISALALPWGAWWLVTALFLLGLGGPSMRVLVDILIFRRVPDDQQGRTMTAFMTVLGAAASIGLFSSGLLLEHLPAPYAILSLAGVLAVAVCFSVADRRIRAIRWPDDSR